MPTLKPQLASLARSPLISSAAHKGGVSRDAKYLFVGAGWEAMLQPLKMVTVQKSEGTSANSVLEKYRKGGIGIESEFWNGV